MKVIKGINDIETLFPEISREWDCSKNEKYNQTHFYSWQW